MSLPTSSSCQNPKMAKVENVNTCAVIVGFAMMIFVEVSAGEVRSGQLTRG